MLGVFTCRVCCEIKVQVPSLDAGVVGPPEGRVVIIQYATRNKTPHKLTLGFQTPSVAGLEEVGLVIHEGQLQAGRVIAMESGGPPRYLSLVRVSLPVPGLFVEGGPRPQLMGIKGGVA